MSRKRKAPVRKVYPDPKFHSEVVSKFINSIMYDGKRSTAEKILYDALEKIKTKNTHGTGCTLSSAIATYYGCGKTLKKSCELGIRYVNNAIRTRPNFGKGNGPINHLNSFIIEKKFR